MTPSLSREAKSLRHDPDRGFLIRLGDSVLLSARDTLGDVGTTITTTAETQRDSLVQTSFHVNLKHCGSPPQPLEEYRQKSFDPKSGPAMEEAPPIAALHPLERSILLRRSFAGRLASASRLYLLK